MTIFLCTVLGALHQPLSHRSVQFYPHLLAVAMLCLPLVLRSFVGLSSCCRQELSRLLVDKNAPLSDRNSTFVLALSWSHRVSKNPFWIIVEIYRKTPNKRPWAFAGIVVLKRTFVPSSSFLRNENRTIFSRDIAKNVIKCPTIGPGM